MSGNIIYINMSYFVIPIIAYLLGSIAFGVILAKVMNKEDIRKKGSGNIGATNAYRIGGKLLGLGTLILDVLKGWVAVRIAIIIYPEVTNLHLLAGIAVIFGHIYPVWYKFRGGKGVATTVGVFLAINSTLSLVAILSWIVIALLFKYASLASLVSILFSAFFALQTQDIPLIVFSSLNPIQLG